VIGVGGISSWEDAVEMIMAGASCIQVGTALMKGYIVFEEIISGLSRYLERKSITLEELCGMAGRRS